MTTIPCEPTRPERNKARQQYFVLVQYRPDAEYKPQHEWEAWSQPFDTETEAVDYIAGCMRSPGCRYRDYRVLSVELPLMPAPKPPKDD